MAVVPDGEDLCSGSTATADLSADPGIDVVEIVVTPGVQLISGANYAIVCRCPTGTYISTEENNAAMWGQEISDVYANGTKCLNPATGAAGNWTSYSTRDCYFVTKASGVSKDSCIVDVPHLQFIYGSWWAAQTFTASSTYTITSVVLKIGKSIHATDPGTLYVAIKRARGVPGKATTPSPADAVTGQRLNVSTLSWVAGADTDTYNVHFTGYLAPVSVAQAGVTCPVPGIPLEYRHTYSWRIDSTNTVGTTTGDTWSFSTSAFMRMWTTARYRSDGTPVPEDTTFDPDTMYYTGENFLGGVAMLVAAANNSIWYERVKT